MKNLVGLSFTALLLSTVLADAGLAVEKPVINWGFSDTSTLPAKTRKFLFTEHQNLYRLLVEGMPEYRHTSFYGSVLRIEHELKKGPRTCFPASSSANLRKSFTYLTPLYLASNLVLVLRKDLAEKNLGKDGKVSLRKLMQNKKLRPILAEARSYGPAIDKIIMDEGMLVPRQISQPFGVNTVDMISHDRGDFSIEYEFIIKQYISSNDRNTQVTTAPIEEIPAFNTQYLACSKTPQGLEIIKKVDQLLRAREKETFYKESILAFSADPLNKSIEKAVTNFVKDRQKQSIIIQ